MDMPKSGSSLKKVVSCFALGTLTLSARADTLEVPSEHATIQAAIVAASGGDTVLVSPGVYSEHIDFLGKAITVVSTHGPTVTALDGGGTGTVVTFATGEGSSSVLEGFLVRDGDPGAASGGGVLCNGTAPVLRDCRFRLNQAQNGAGVYLVNSPGAAIESCTFDKNAATDCGGGLEAFQSTVSIADCSFYTNTAGTDGGGMLSTGGSMTVTGSLFSGNSANVDGGGMSLKGGTGSVTSCAVVLNWSTYGGGIYIENNATMTVAGCLVGENHAWSFGGGIDISSASPTITNSTFCNNTADIAQGGVGGINASPAIANTLVWANGSGGMGFNGTSFPSVTHSNVEGGFAGTGNLDQDPLLRSLEGGNYRLMAGSPCIDAGDDAAPGVPVTDYDGEARVATVDIGADEFGPEGPLFLDRHLPGDLRLLNFNVNNDSIFPSVNAVQAAKFERIVNALNPDVVCLQEVSVPASDVEDLMDAIAPLGGGASWQAHRALDRGDVLVSKYALSMQATGTVPSGWRGPAMALVDLPDAEFDNDLYVIGTHFKCCGDDTEDGLRQQQADAITNWIRDARTPGGAINLPAGTGFVVAGDLNLVHAFQPAATLLGGNIIDEGTYGSDSPPDWDGTMNTDAHPFHNGRELYDYTWRNDWSSFAPGRLDFVTYSDSALQAANVFILNTSLMSTAELTASGLQRWDVTLDLAGEHYDHLPLVVDFRQAEGLSQPFCDISDGALAFCPCGNAGNPDSGCDIQQATGGVRLDVAALETVPQNRATFTGTGYPVSSLPASIVIRGTSIDSSSPVVFGDGLRCVGVPIVRLAATFASFGTSTHTFGHGVMAGPGAFHYQLWFRNTPAMFCTPEAFNLSNGQTVSW
jgi:endonuclease/exonuclease/phosphatase family metal-dependent hydrolase